MSKRMTRVLSLILTLVMFVTVSTPAFAWGGGDLGSGWDREIGEDEIRDFDEPVVEEEETLDYFHAIDEDSLLEVTVEAPMGALPTLAELRAEPVEVEDVREAVESVVEGKANILVAMDISFWMNGVEIEPEEPVNVKISAPELADKSNLTLVHIPDAAEPETIDLIDEGDLGFALGTTEIAFKANSFSVYAIVAGDDTPADDQPYRTTYEFYNADGSRYYFKDAAGRDQYTQILKDGEKLEDVGIPTVGASSNAKFVGWYDDNGNKVEVGEAKTVTANTTIKLTAKMQGIVNVYFVSAVMEGEGGEGGSSEGGGRSIVIVKQVEFTVGQSEPITVDTADVTTNAPKAEQAVVGWNRDETAANAGTAEGTGDNKTITLFTNTDDIHDVTLFPAIKDAYWLFFDENDGGTGGGASYTPPQFVMIGAKPTKPADPHRTGYTFGGWYKDADCTQAFSFDEPLDQTRRVYAKWDGAATTYTVVVWVQRTADSANLPTNGQNVAEANRTYDFYKAYTINATTGGTATVANTYKNLANGSSSELFNNGHVKYNRCDADKTVAGNGSTVMNVYYDRDVMTIHWRYSQNGSDFDTWYGLYGARLSEAGKTWKTPDSGYKWRTPRYSRLTYKDSFEDFDYTADTSLVIYRASDSTTYYDYYFYTENLDGSWKLDQQIDKDRYTTFTLSEKYTGFHVYQYSHNNTRWNAATSGASIDTDGNFYVRYARNVNTLSFRNGTKGTSGSQIGAYEEKFEASLVGHATPATPTYPVAADADHYQFIGWFADTAWTTMVTFEELSQKEKDNYSDWYGISTFVVYDKMPNNNLVLYAGYSLKGWDCALNPNNGTFTDETQAGVFWLDYGGKFASTLKTGITREGYIFQGWMLANVPKDDDGNLVLLGVQTDENNHRFVTDFSNWTETETPWQFDTGITGATALTAKWFYKTALTVQYDANGGSNAPTDQGEYSDHATTVAFAAPTAPAGQNFLGWDIQGTDAVEKVKPGDTFEVSSDYAVEGVVTLVAVYSAPGSDEEVPVTHIDWYANNTETDMYDDPNFVPVEGDDEIPDQITMPLHVSDTDLQLNKGVDIRPATTFSNYGYKFLGWAKLHEDGGTKKDHKNNTVNAAADGDHMDYALTADNLYLKFENDKFLVETSDGWVETSQVAADEHLPYDDMYAVWEKEYFYVYHSSSCEVVRYEVAEGENGFDLTQLVADNFMYGGYYKKYNRAGADFDATKAEYTDNKTTDSNGTHYVGGPGAWSKARAYTTNGSKMIPEADTTYFLKEVPNEVYLKMYTHVVYDTHDNNKVVKVFMITDVDDNNYSTIDLYTEDTMGNRVKLAVSYVFGENAKTGVEEVTINAKTFGAEGGYIAIWNPDLSGLSGNNIIATYTTPDGVIVDGAKMRVVNKADYFDPSASITAAPEGKFGVTDKANTITLVDGVKGNYSNRNTKA